MKRLKLHRESDPPLMELADCCQIAFPFVYDRRLCGGNVCIALALLQADIKMPTPVPKLVLHWACPSALGGLLTQTTKLDPGPRTGLEWWEQI